MAEAVSLEFSLSGGKYVAEFTAEAEYTAVQVVRSARGMLQVFVGLGGLDPASVKAWGSYDVPDNKVFDVHAPIGAVVRIVSGSAVTEAYCLAYEDE